MDSAEKQRRQKSFFHVIDLPNDPAQSLVGIESLCLKKKTFGKINRFSSSFNFTIKEKSLLFILLPIFFVDLNDMKCVDVTFEFFVAVVVTVFINSYPHTLDVAKGCLALP